MGMTIGIAAADSAEKDKRAADVICTGRHDEETINAQIEKLTRGGTLRFFDGSYRIDAFPHEGNTAILFGYNDGNARVINVVGDTENIMTVIVRRAHRRQYVHVHEVATKKSLLSR